jgi:hypothetical protein
MFVFVAKVKERNSKNKKKIYGFRRVTCSSIDFKGKEKEKGF